MLVILSDISAIVSLILLVVRVYYDTRVFTNSYLVSFFFYSSNTALYWSVRDLVNSSSYYVSSLLTYSIMSNLWYISSLFIPIQFPLWVTSSCSLDIAILVAEAASLSAVIIVLLSDMPLCISEQYLPYAFRVAEFFSTAWAIYICWVWRVIQLFCVCSSKAFIFWLPAFSCSFRNEASL